VAQDDRVIAYKSLNVEETGSAVYIEADNHKVWMQQPPRLGTRCVIEFEAVFTPSRADLEDKRLVQVSEEHDGHASTEALAP